MGISGRVGRLLGRAGEDDRRASSDRDYPNQGDLQELDFLERNIKPILLRFVDVPSNDEIHRRLLHPTNDVDRDEEFLNFMDVHLFPGVLQEFNRLREQSEFYLAFKRVFIQDIAWCLMLPMQHVMHAVGTPGVLVMVPQYFPYWLASLVDGSGVSDQIIEHHQRFSSWLVEAYLSSSGQH